MNSKPDCKHLAGLAWMINGEEGTAHITRFYKSTDKPDDSDILYTFQFCPVCGEQLQEHEEINSLTMNNARWKG